MTEITAYPLAWPQGWPRTPESKRVRGYSFKQATTRFDSTGAVRTDRTLVTTDVARRKLRDELRRLGATDVILSTNLPLRQDGEPRSDASRFRMDDSGVAVYFTLKRRKLVMAQDAYDGVAANLRSLGLAIEALRQMERHGGGTMMERAFTGFAALPPPGDEKPWWKVLGLPPNATAAMINSAHRSLVSIHHPDRGGSAERMAEINAARDRALANPSAL